MNKTILNTLNENSENPTDSRGNLYITGFVARIWERNGLLFAEMDDNELSEATICIDIDLQNNPAITVDKCPDSRDILIRYTFPTSIPVKLIHPNDLENLAEEITSNLESDYEFSVRFSHLIYKTVEINSSETSDNFELLSKLLNNHNMYLTLAKH